MSEESAWQCDPRWKTYAAKLNNFVGKLTIVDLCGGLGTGYIALSLVLPRGCVESGGIWDTDSHLARFLGLIHADSKVIHLGSIGGDLMKMNIADIGHGHIIVAGPPCPPWSRLGNKGSFGDERSTVFWRVVDIVIHQANRGFLGLFVLENVENIVHKAPGCETPASDILLKALRDELPHNWKVDIVFLNSASYGLPQSRNRAFIIGHRTDLFGSEDIVSPMPFEGTVPLANLLDLDDKVEVVPGTPTQQSNLLDWKQHSRSTIENRTASDSFAVFDVSRTPSRRTAWQARGYIDTVECLTATGTKNLHILSLGGGGEPEGHVALDRQLRCHERARLQGFPAVICNEANESSENKRVFGNAMTVPVIGSILACEMLSLCKHSSATKIAHWCAASAHGHCRDVPLVYSSSRAASSSGDSPAKRQRTDEAGVLLYGQSAY